MSELINNPSQRLKKLLAFTRAMIDGEPGHPLVLQYKSVTDKVTPTETMEVLDILIKEGMPVEKVKAWVPKILNVFYNSLKEFQWEVPSKDHFLHYLMEENRAVENVLEDIRTISKTAFSEKRKEEFELLRQRIADLIPYELHYIKKENILFPYIEKAFEGHRCLSVMWSFHDDYRQSIKNLDNLLQTPLQNISEISRELGKLFFVIKPIIFREEQIIFPVALRAIPQKQWDAMLAQSEEIGWCYITPPKIEKNTKQEKTEKGMVDLDTGILLPEQIKWMLNTLPVDITFIDDKDEVRYFSGGEGRIFHRSKAVIGRKVQNCHPPESVHMVEEIVDAFKDGSRDHADFWLTMKDRFIHIRYFAVRDEEGNYQGTLEMSQDATEVRSLQGQRRLLEWD